MNDPVVLGMGKVLINFWPAVLYMIIGLILLRRWERNEEKRMEAIIKRQNANKTYKSSSNF